MLFLFVLCCPESGAVCCASNCVCVFEIQCPEVHVDLVFVMGFPEAGAEFRAS